MACIQEVKNLGGEMRLIFKTHLTISDIIYKYSEVKAQWDQVKKEAFFFFFKVLL